MDKNPNCKEVNQLAILQAWPRIWTLDKQKQIQLAVRVGIELGAFELQVQRFLTRSCCLHLHRFLSKHSATVYDLQKE